MILISFFFYFCLVNNLIFTGMKRFLLVALFVYCCDMLSAINQTERQELFNEYILSFPEWQNDSSSMPSYLINPDLYGKDAIPKNMVNAFIPIELMDTAHCEQKYFGFGNKITREKDYVVFLTGECPIEDTKVSSWPYHEGYIITYRKDGTIIDFIKVCRHSEISCGEISQRSNPFKQIIAQAYMCIEYSEFEEPNIELPQSAEVFVQKIKITKKGRIKKKKLYSLKAMIIWKNDPHRMSIEWPKEKFF